MQESDILALLEPDTVIFSSSIRGDPEDSFEIPFVVFKTWNSHCHSVNAKITLPSKHLWNKKAMELEEWQWTFPEVTFFTRRYSDNKMEDLIELEIMGYTQGFVSVFGSWEPEIIETVDSIIKKAIAVAIRAYEFGKPVPSNQLAFDF